MRKMHMRLFWKRKHMIEIKMAKGKMRVASEYVSKFGRKTTGK